MIALCCNVVTTHEINAFLSTPFLFFQYEVVAMDSTKIARSHPNKRNRSKDIFTLSGCEKSLLTPIFLESTEQNTYKAFDNKTQTVPMNTGSSENREFKQTPADKQNAPTEDVEEEPKLEPQDLLLWALKPNKLERFSKLLELPEVSTKFKCVSRLHNLRGIGMQVALGWKIRKHSPRTWGQTKRSRNSSRANTLCCQMCEF